MAGLSLSRRCQYAVDRALVGRRWHRALAAQFGELTADSVMSRVWRDYLVRLAAQPPAPSWRAALVRRWTTLAIAVYRALVARGQPPELARAVLRNLAWDGYRVTGGLAWALAWRPGRTRLARTRAAMGHFRRLFFAEPDFAWRELPEQAGRAGFDCLRCPIERAFAAEGLAEVAVHSLCSLERRMSASWGMRLVRTQTLADGGSHCDFRWYARDVRPPRPTGAAPAPAPAPGND
jgi:hypothetical protein